MFIGRSQSNQQLLSPPGLQQHEQRQGPMIFGGRGGDNRSSIGSRQDVISNDDMGFNMNDDRFSYGQQQQQQSMSRLPPPPSPQQQQHQQQWNMQNDRSSALIRNNVFAPLPSPRHSQQQQQFHDFSLQSPKTSIVGSGDVRMQQQLNSSQSSYNMKDYMDDSSWLAGNC